MKVSLLPSWWITTPVCGPTIHTGAVAFAISGRMKIDPCAPYSAGSFNGVAHMRVRPHRAAPRAGSPRSAAVVGAAHHRPPPVPESLPEETAAIKRLVVQV